jgi:hypothetical protein
MQKVSLAHAFASFSDTLEPKVAGAVNGMEVKRAKVSGEFVRHHHAEEDCDAQLLEPATTVDTGHVRNERTVTELGRIGQA